MVVWLEVRRNDDIGFAEKAYSTERFWDILGSNAVLSDSTHSSNPWRHHR